MTKYLDQNGLAYFWTKIKAWLSSHAPVKYFGQNWVEDTNNDYALVVGNGVDENNPSNAMTIDNDGVVHVHAPNIDANTPSQSYLCHEALRIEDVNGDRRGFIELVDDTNGQGLSFSAQCKVNGVNQYNGFRMMLDQAGNPFDVWSTVWAKRKFLESLQPAYFQFHVESDKPDVYLANNGISSNTYPSVEFVDKNGVRFSDVEGEALADGRCGAALWAWNYDTSGNEIGSCGLGVRVTKSGEPQYWASNSAKFRTGIGANSDGIWPISLGGTGQSSPKMIVASSSNISTPSGMSLRGGQFIVWGRVVMLHLVVRTSSAISIPANGFVTDKHLATISDSKLRPAVDCNWCETGNDSVGGCDGTINGSNGQITLTQCDGTGSARTAAANSDIDIWAVYLRNSGDV